MAYAKTNWVNEREPAINAENLNKIEEGIYQAHEGLNQKVEKETGKGLSTKDYTAADKAKVDAIPADPKYTDTVYDDTEIKKEVNELKSDLNNKALLVDSEGYICLGGLYE